MALPFAFLASLIALYLLFTKPKRDSLLSQIVLFMLIVACTRSTITILSMEMELFEITSDPFLFVYFLLYREIILPAVVMLFVASFIAATRPLHKLRAGAVTLVILLGLDFLHVHFEVIKHTSWSYFYAFLLNLSHLLLGILFAYFIFWLDRKGGSSDARYV